MHIVVGLALGWVVGRHHVQLWAALIIGSTLSVAWGVLVAFDVWSSDDSNWFAGLIGGTLVAIVNTALGVVIGAPVSRVLERTPTSES